MWNRTNHTQGPGPSIQQWQVPGLCQRHRASALSFNKQNWVYSSWFQSEDRIAWSWCWGHLLWRNRPVLVFSHRHNQIAKKVTVGQRYLSCGSMLESKEQRLWNQTNLVLRKFFLLCLTLDHEFTPCYPKGVLPRCEDSWGPCLFTEMSSFLVKTISRLFVTLNTM